MSGILKSDDLKAEQAATDLKISKGLEGARNIRLASSQPRIASQERGMAGVQQIQADLGQRLDGLRSERQLLSDAAAQPGLQNIAEQEGYARRQVGIEGSLGGRRRENIATEANLARQGVKAQAFGQQIQSEAGLQQLQNEFTSMFNDMASTRFTQELSGLGEEIDAYMAEKGRDLKYADLATKAQASSDRMMGRLASGLGQAFSGDDNGGYNASSDINDFGFDAGD